MELVRKEMVTHVFPHLGAGDSCSEDNLKEIGYQLGKHPSSPTGQDMAGPQAES